MSRGLASLRGYQEGGPPKGLPQELKSRLQSRLTSGEEMIREVQRKLAEMDNFYNKAENYNFNLWADTRNKEFEEREERELEELRVRMMEEHQPFLDSLQAIVKSPDQGWEKDVPIRVGWNFLEKLIEQGTNPIRHTIAKYRPSKLQHNYLETMDKYLFRIRDDVKKVLEIGVQTDRSVKMFKDYF